MDPTSNRSWWPACAIAVAVAFGLYLVVGGLWIYFDRAGLVIGGLLTSVVVGLGIRAGSWWRWLATLGGVLAVAVLLLFWDVSTNGLLPD